MEDRAVAFLVGCVIFLIVSSLAVITRCYARLKVVNRLAAEDWLMIAAQILYMSELVCCIFQIKYGMGRHISQVHAGDIRKAFLLLFIGAHLYATVMMLARMSIGLLLLRLMATKRQEVAIWFVLAVNVTFWFMYVVWTFNICTPLARYWEWDLGHSKCRISRYAIGSYIQSASAIFSDMALALIPSYVLYKSKLARRTRYATAGVLSLGVVASISTMIRLVAIKEANEIGPVDFMYNIGEVLLWSVIEQGLAILAGCIATYRPLFVKVARLTEVSDGTRGRSGRPAQPGDTQFDWDPGLTIDLGVRDDEEVDKTESVVRVRSALVSGGAGGGVGVLGPRLDAADSRKSTRRGDGKDPAVSVVEKT